MAAKEAPEDKVVEIVDLERKVDEPEKQQPRPEETEEKDASDEFGGPVSLRKLCSLASRGEMLVLLLGTLGAVAHGSGMPIISAMIGEFIDIFWDNRGAVTMSQITALALKFVAIGGGLVVVGSLQGFAFPWFAQKQVKKMRPVYLDAALHRDIAWFDVHDIPSLIFGMSNDLEVYVDAFSEKLGQSFMSLGTLLIGFTLGIYYCWQIGLLMILAVFLMGAAGSVTGQAIVEQVTETQGSYAAASKLVAEVLHAIRTVVAFGGERRELVRYEASVEEARRMAVRSKAKVGVGSGVLFGIFISAQGVAFLVGAHLMYDGLDISIGKLSTAMFCCLTAGFSMGQLAPGFAGLGNAKLAMRRFFFMKEHQSEIQTSGCTGKALESIESLKLEGVHFAYPARPSIQVLSGLTLDIKKGQKIGVVGESGSGKSTVMALLERFYDPLQGQVLVNGTDLKLYSVKSLRAQIGYVGQEPVLFATSIKENIKQGKSDATDEDMKRAAKHARLDFVKKLPAKFESFVGSGGSQLSGGQKQRIAIARALVKKPSMLLLDEATSALDGPSEKQIQDTIDKIGSASELGMTIVAIAHRLSTVKNSDVIYVLQGGQVAEQGSHGELLAKDGGIYRTLAATQHMDSEQVQEEADAEEEPQVPKGRASVNSLASWGSLQEELAAREEAARTPKTYKVPMRRLLAFCRQEWCFFVPGVIGAMLSGCVFPVSAAYCVVDASVDLANPDKDAMMADIKVTALWTLAFACARAVADTLCVGCFGVLSEAVCKRCRVAMLTTVFRQEVGFHDDPQNSPARIADALQKWTFRVQNFLTNIMGQASALAAVLGGSIVALANSWETAAVMLAFMPLVALASSIQIQVQMGGKSKDDLKLRAAQEVLSEALMSVRTVQASNCEEDLLALYSQQLEQASPLKELLSLLSSGIIFGIANGVLFWNYAVGFWMMGFFIVEGRTDYISGMRAFLGVIFAGYGVSIAFGLLGDMGKARAAARDIFQLLDRQTAINGLEPDGQVPAEALQIGRFEFEAVNFYYPFRASIQVLKDFSCVIEAGQSVGIVGPSGGGKSTMLSMIQRFYDPQSGTVYVGKERMPLKDLDIRWWRKQVGFVGQEPVLFDATVLENVMYGFEPDENVSAEWLAHCKAMANLTFLDDHKAQGWETQVGLRGGRLSGGQKQRVAICRALLRNPPVLLLDEATSALDSKSEEVVQAALDRAKEGRTSFAIAHRLSTIQDCDVIVVVADGRVAEQGSHSELLEKKGVYYDLQAQQERKRAG